AVAERPQQAPFEEPHRARDAFAGGEPRKAATIAIKDFRIGVAAGGEPQEHLVRVVAREQRPRLELVARALGLGLHGGQPAEVAAPQPRQPERRERLEQRALAARGAPRAARDEPDAAVADGQAFEELARVAVRPLVQHEAGLEPDGLALAHDTSKPKRFSSRSLSAQCSRTLTQSSRCTRA